MTETSPIQVLISEIEKSSQALQKINDFYQSYALRLPPSPNRTLEQAIVISELLVNYYTCLETIFLRISQYFENSLSHEKWHQDLLRKMTLDLQGVRERVLADETANLLSELLKFRHFKRYYFDFHYDWDQLDFLRKKYEQVLPLVKSDLDRFMKFLIQLLANQPQTLEP